MKYIKLIFDDEYWLIPLEHIAKNRADYYKEIDGNDADYQGEIDFIMNDSYEGIDWLKNNMNLEDFIEVRRIIKIDSAPEKDFCNAESEIVEE